VAVEEFAAQRAVDDVDLVEVVLDVVDPAVVERELEVRGRCPVAFGRREDAEGRERLRRGGKCGEGDRAYADARILRRPVWMCGRSKT